MIDDQTVYSKNIKNILEGIISKLNGIENNFKKVKKAILDAYEFADSYHKGQTRASGEPYILHPLMVADLLSDVFLDIPSIQAAILHDTVEDTSATLEEIQKKFGYDVCFLVDGLTKINQVTFFSNEEKWAENFRKMLLATAKDIRIILIKLSDRLHNLRTIQILSEEKRNRIAEESLDIYAPLAGRLGIYRFKSEMEDLCLKVLKPNVYKNLRTIVARKKSEREAKVQENIEKMQKNVENYGFPCKVYGRAKHFYSIYKKMFEKQIPFQDVHDLIGLRILVDTKAQCYETLGLVHGEYRPVTGRFKDYIAMPKFNMYQSLHTTVITDDGDLLEIQIRTYEMNHVAENGIAAHWAYKEKKFNNQKNVNLAKTYGWLNRVLHHNQLSDPSEYLEAVKTELFDDEVFVFSPKGDVYELKKNSTVLDFAFAVHSDLGMTTYGAKKNGQLVSLKTKVQNGNVIEILADKKIRINKNWLNFVQTNKAKSKIRAYLNQKEKEISSQEGLAKLNEILGSLNLNYEHFTSSREIEKIFKRLKVSNLSSLILKVGYKKIQEEDLLQAIQSAFHFTQESEQFDQTPEFEKYKESKKKKKDLKLADLITVQGEENIALKIAKCCNPLPFVSISGVVLRSSLICVHRSNCSWFLSSDPNRRVSCAWKRSEDDKFSIQLLVRVQNEPAILANFAKKLYNDNIPIYNIAIFKEYSHNQTDLKCSLTIKNNAECLNIIQKIEALIGVLKVLRVR
jgi:GTP pyrophosphokinase